MGAAPRQNRGSDPALIAAVLILLLAVAALSLHALLQTGALRRLLIEIQPVREEEEVVEPGAAPAPPAPTPAPTPRPVPGPPAPPAAPRAVPPAARLDTLPPLPPRAPAAPFRSYGIARFERDILARLDRDRPAREPLTGVARVRIGDIVLRDPAGGNFATAESVSAGVDLGALRAGDLVVTDAVLLRPDVRIRRAPGRPWNFEQVWRRLVGLPAARADGEPLERVTVRIEDLVIREGRAVVEGPTTRFALLGIEALVARAILADPARPSPELVIRTASADIVPPEPGRRFAATAADATLLFDDGVAFTAAAATVDGARLTDIRGTSRPATGLELTLRAEGVRLATVQWLVPQLPAEGEASFTLALEPLPGRRSRVALTGLDARSGASRLTGSIAVVVGAPGPTLEAAELRADPLELALLEPLLGRQPFSGLLRGTITASARTLGFDVTAELTAAGATRGFTAALTGTATCGADGFRLTNLVAELTEAPLAAFRPLVPVLPLSGTVTGRVSVVGPPGAAPLELDVRLALAVGVLLVRGELDLRGREPAYRLTGRVLDVSLAALFGPRAPPARLTAGFSLSGSGTDAATADLELSLAGRFTGWRTDAGDAVAVELVLADGVLRVDRGVLGLATLDAEVTGIWRFVPPAAGALRYALRFASLAPFAPYLPLAADSIAEGVLVAQGDLTGPADRVRLRGTASGEGLRLDGWRAASLEATYEVEPRPVPAAFVVVASARGVQAPVVGAYDTARVEYRQEPPLFSLQVAAARRGGGVLALAADGRILEQGRREAVLRRFVADADGRRWVLVRPAGLAWGGIAGLVVDDVRLVEQGGPGRVSVDGRVPREGPADLIIATAALPVGGLFEAVLGDTTATGLLWLDARVGGVAAAPVVQAEFRVEQASLQGVALGRLSGDLRYAGQRLEVEASSSLEPARALEVRASLPFDFVLEAPPRWRVLDRGPLHASLLADSVGLAAFEPWLRDVRDLEGTFSGRASLSGTVDAPQLAGSFALRGGAVTLIALDRRYTNISADIELEGQRVIVNDLRAPSDGSAVATGTITVETLSRPILDLSIAFDGFRAFSARDGEAAAVTGEIALTGPLAAPVVAGRVVLEDGTVPVDALTGARQPELELYTESELLAIPGIDDAPPPTSPLASLTFDRLVVVAGDALWFDTEETRVRLAGQLVLIGGGNDLRIFGTLQGERGTFTLEAGPVLRRFDVERAEVRFLGSTPPDPMLDVTAVRRVPLGAQREIDIVARITGTASNPVVSFTTPEGAAIPESELLSFLVFGRPSFALGEAEFLGQGLLGEFFLTGLTELTAIELERELAADLGLDFFEIRPGFGAFGGLGLPTVAFGREIAEDVFLTVEAGLGRLAGVETTAAIAVRLQWRIDNEWQLELALEPATRARLLRGGTVVLPLAPPEQQLLILIRRRWTY
ncbi:MAG TPA: translocation/assembly module TamB domain-containing protein [Longimicrobiales bacterium]